MAPSGPRGRVARGGEVRSVPLAGEDASLMDQEVETELLGTPGKLY